MMLEKKQPAWRERCRESLLAFPYFFGLAVVKGLPQWFVIWFFNRLASYLARKENIIRQYRANLARVLAVDVHQVPDSLILAGMRSYLRYWREVFRLSVMDKAKIIADMQCTGEENIEYAMNAGKGLILALPHSGNWDIAGVWLVNKYQSFYTVNERLRPEKLYQKMIDYRESLGFRVLVAGSHPYEKLKEHLLSGGIVCLLVDRCVSRSGVTVNFFGQEALIPIGPTRLAYETGAQLCPAFAGFKDKGWTLNIASPVNHQGTIEHMTQEMIHFFEEHISCAPQDWHAFQPIWDNPRAKVLDMSPYTDSLLVAPDVNTVVNINEQIS